MRRRTPEAASSRAIAAAVAAAVAALALAGGGYGAQPRAIACILVWWLVGAGALAGVLPLAAPARAGRWLLALLAALALATLASLAWASDDGAAFQSVVLALLYLGIASLALTTLTRETAVAWLRGLAAGLTLIAGLALASRLWPGGFHDAVAAGLPAARARLSYPVGYWNALGLAMASAVLLLAWAASRGATQLGRSAALALVPAPALALYLTSSRGAVAALLAGLLVLIALERRRLALLAQLALAGAGALATIAFAASRHAFTGGATDAVARSEGRAVLAVLVATSAGLAVARYAADGALRRAAEWQAPRRLAASGLALALAAGVAGLVAVDPGARLDAFEQPPAPPRVGDASAVASHLLSSGGSGRYQFWTAAWHAFERHPIDGIGAGGYEAWWTQHASLPYSVRNAHSFVLETLAELGGTGGIVLLALAALVLLTALRRRRAGSAAETLAVAAALAACGAVSASVDWMWQVPAVLAPALVGIAVLTGLPAPTRRPVRAMRGFACAAAAGAIALAAIALAADVELARSHDAARAGRLEDAATAAANAAAIEPWAAAPRLQLALVAEREGDLRAALRAASQALTRAPRDWRLRLVMTRLHAKAGDVAGAEAALRRLRCLNPRFPFRQIGALDSLRSLPVREVECVERRNEQRPRGGAPPPR